MLLNTLLKVAHHQKPGRGARFACREPIHCGLTEGSLVDVSSGGMKLRCCGPVPVNCWLQVALGDGTKIRGWVVWTIRRGFDTDVGLRYDADTTSRETWLRRLLFAA